VTAETVEPAYTKLLAIQNTSGSGKMPKLGMVAMWDGTLASIPIGWDLCDGTKGTIDMRSRFLKITNTFADRGNTGGSNTHTHAAQSHSHTGSGTHSHSITTGTFNGNITAIGSGNNVSETHSHTGTSDSQTINYQNANTTADSSDNQPSYYTVAYIQYKFSVGGAALFAMA
jgi:hypothetical protein